MLSVPVKCTLSTKSTVKDCHTVSNLTLKRRKFKAFYVSRILLSKWANIYSSDVILNSQLLYICDVLLTLHQLP